MDTMPIIDSMPMVIISSPGINGLVRLNDAIVGEINNEQQFLHLPLSPNGNYYLTFIPIWEDSGKVYCPITKKLSFRDGELVFVSKDDSFMIVQKWPGRIYKLLIAPPYTQSPEKMGAPLLLQELAWKPAKSEYRVAIYKDNCINIAVESQQDDSVYMLFTPKFSKLDAHGEIISTSQLGDILYIKGSVDEKRQFITIVSYIKGEFVILLDTIVKQQDITPSSEDFLTVVEDIDDLVQHEKKTVYTIKGQSLSIKSVVYGWFNRKPIRPQERHEVVYAFLDAMKLHLYSESMNYLSVSLKEDLSNEDLADFIGDFESHENTIADPTCGGYMELQRALLYNAGGEIIVNIFCFEIIEEQNKYGTYKINNIRQIT